MKALIAKGADVNAPVGTTTIFAHLGGSLKTPEVETIKTLLDAGASINLPIEHPALIEYTRIAADGGSGDIEILKLMLNKKYNTNVNKQGHKGETPLITAIRNMRPSGFPVITYVA